MGIFESLVCVFGIEKAKQTMINVLSGDNLIFNTKCGLKIVLNLTENSGFSVIDSNKVRFSGSLLDCMRNIGDN